PTHFSLQVIFFFSSRRRHTRWPRDWSSDVCSSDLLSGILAAKIPDRWTKPGSRNAASPPSVVSEWSRSTRRPHPGTSPRRENSRSEERRVGKAGRLRRARDREKKEEGERFRLYDYN